MKTKLFCINRRYILLAAFGILIFSGLSPNQLSAQMEATPFVGRGPFFPTNADSPMDNDLTSVTGNDKPAQGEVIELRGTIRDTQGSLVSGAEVLIWQTDNKGNYDHPDAAKMMGKTALELDSGFQYWGKTISDQNGNYFFKTILPIPYLVANIQRPAHIHFRVKHPHYKYLTMELHFPDDQYLEDDEITSHLDEEDHVQLMAKITVPPPGYGNKIAGFNIVLAKK